MSELIHYGIPRRSGRYPWGSGEDPYQSGKSFLARVDELKKNGLSEVERAKALGMTTTQLRAKVSIAKDEKFRGDASLALRLKEKGYSNVAIGQRMGIPESSVRNLLDPSRQSRRDITMATADMLKDTVAKKGYIDVGVGVERHIGISRTKLKTSLEVLEDQGYTIHYVPVEQLGTGKKTSVMVLAPPDTTYSDVWKNRYDIKGITDYSEDGGRTYLGLEPPKSIDSKRIQINYYEDGGKDKDGVIELRRGVDDISLGNARYAQVRIAVDGTHYLKGMAMYSDDLPEGVDIRFNTNKHAGTPMIGPKDNSVLKPMKDDPDNPFGATIKGESELLLAQRHYIDDKGKRQLSAINVVNEEGNWSNWQKALSSQVLSKQPVATAKKQLDLAFNIKKDEYDEIMSLTNPAIKKKLLDSFADDCDSSSVHLKAAALPRQASHVILPFPDMKENEIYAPNYRNGENVVLIRYPHGGKFEIPELVVNNKHETAIKTLGRIPDAVGINPKVAERLSGADFDGDTVLVIPNNSGAIRTKSPLKDLKNFDPQEAYPGYEGMPRMTAKTKGIKMGEVSNLITDMTIKGATDDEICRAVRHSMVVIDAEKHNLDYKRSYTENGIAQLREKYQGGANKGASTLISRASSEERVPHRKEGQLVTDPNTGKTRRMYVDPRTGKKLYEETGETYIRRTTRKDGTVKETVVPRTTKSTKMYEVENAFQLSSGTSMEEVYAIHANKLKALANEARKASVTTKSTEYSPSAAKTYSNEVASLKAQLNIAEKNKPLERQAQLVANGIVAAKRKANPDMDADELKKIKGQALNEGRRRTGAGKKRIDISDKEWEAIQSGAVSNSTLLRILDNTDLDKVKQLATPRSSNGISPSKLARARSMLERGYTQADIADQLGISVSTLNKEL